MDGLWLEQGDGAHAWGTWQQRKAHAYYGVVIAARAERPLHGTQVAQVIIAGPACLYCVRVVHVLASEASTVPCQVQGVKSVVRLSSDPSILCEFYQCRVMLSIGSQTK